MRKLVQLEFARFFVNGLVAAAVHFTALTILIEVVHVPWAAVANVMAAILGIASSFIGNRYFVFRNHEGSLVSQLGRFALLYGVTVSLHAGILYVWSDMLHFDYRIGFLIASALQMVLGYAGNKLVVFAQ